MAKNPTGIRLKSGAWYGRWNDEHGILRERRLSTDRREAIRMRSEIIARVQRLRLGLEDDGRGATLRSLPELVDEWRTYLGSRTTPKHADDSKRGVLRLIALTGARRVGELDGPRIERALVKMVAQGLSNRTVNKEIGYVRTFCKWAKRAGHVSSVPEVDFDPLPTVGRYQRKVRRKLSMGELTRLISAAEEDASAHILMVLVAGTGMRLNEALSMNWGDFDGARLHIQAGRSKSHQERYVSLPAWLVAILEAERARRGAKAKESVAEGSAIAVSKTGQRWAAMGARKAFIRIRERAKLPLRFTDGTELDWHSLRHTFATNMANAGASASALQAQMGWKSIRMAQVYVDLAQVETQRFVESMPVPQTGQILGKNADASRKGVRAKQ